MCVSLKGTVHRRASNRFIEIDQMPVKLGAVDAGKLDFAANRKATAAAHTRAVNHNGIHRNNGGNVIFLG